MPGSHKKGPIVSQQGFSVGKKTNKTEVIDKDAYIKPDRIREDVLRVAKVTVTNAQIKAMHATPVVLVAAPGAGKMLQVESVVLRLNYGSNVFTGGRAIRLGIDNATRRAFGDIAHGNFHENTANHVYHAQPAIAGHATAAHTENKNFAMQAQVGEIAGNAGGDNTFTVWVHYRILTV